MRLLQLTWSEGGMAVSLAHAFFLRMWHPGPYESKSLVVSLDLILTGAASRCPSGRTRQWARSETTPGVTVRVRPRGGCTYTHVGGAMLCLDVGGRPEDRGGASFRATQGK
jgi:hypothetical protein